MPKTGGSNLFLKKKQADETPTISCDNDQRESFRYVFDREKQLSGSFKGRRVQILNISAGGIAFKNQGFKKYDADTMSLDLTMPNYNKNPQFTAQIRILHLTANEICHCIFENCTVEDYEIVHKYVLEMQKQELRKK